MGGHARADYQVNNLFARIPKTTACSVCNKSFPREQLQVNNEKLVCWNCIFKIADGGPVTLEGSQRDDVLGGRRDAPIASSAARASLGMASEDGSTYPLVETRSCPYCGEQVQIAAKKCKHCGEWFDKRPSVPASNSTAPVASPAQIPACPRCGCQSFQIVKRGYDAQTGCCVGFLLGPLGLLCGFAGSGQTFSACTACGHQVIQPTVSNFINTLIMLLFYLGLTAVALWIFFS